MSIERAARKDAREYARAQMFYGEGAGTRRKLIETTVKAKSEQNDAYRDAFAQELGRQDMAEHAAAARRERRRRDAAESASRNTKAIATGNYQNAQAGVLVVAALVYVAHQTGLDKKAVEKSKKIYRDVRHKIKHRRTKNAPVHTIHSL